MLMSLDKMLDSMPGMARTMWRISPGCASGTNGRDCDLGRNNEVPIKSGRSCDKESLTCGFCL